MTSSLQEVEQFIPFVQKLFDFLRSARDYFTSNRREKSENSIEIPKKTLILLPGIHSHALRWGLGTVGDRPPPPALGYQKIPL
jgi:hypothetical protein